VGKPGQPHRYRRKRLHWTPGPQVDPPTPFQALSFCSLTQGCSPCPARAGGGWGDLAWRDPGQETGTLAEPSDLQAQVGCWSVSPHLPEGGRLLTQKRTAPGLAQAVLQPVGHSTGLPRPLNNPGLLQPSPGLSLGVQRMHLKEGPSSHPHPLMRL
jgi:hypothetical protein